ncbi:MAG TPA: MFS transporter [Myxococcales bacterium]|nr:MFS transporter [Myxococcales bacterium]
MRRLLPPTASRDAPLLIATRAARGMADGIASVLLASYLTRLGFDPVQIGAIATATLFGSAALLLFTGLFGHRFPRRTVLLASSALMCATGVAFYLATGFWPLLLIAFVGTLNPSAGDVTLFLPTEQAVLAEAAAPEDRTALFAWYNLAGAFAGAFGSLAAGLPDLLAPGSAASAERAAFLVYAGIGAASALAYRKLSGDREPPPAVRAPPLEKSRGVVIQLAALFSVDSFGGGFVVQSILALWLFRRFQVPVTTAGAIFFAMNLMAAFSQLVSARIAARIGHVRTMVFTHLPSNLFLLLAGVMPTLPLAALFLLLRAMVSQMDVPARQAYVMAMVPREERVAAASVTNVPRSLAAAIGPLLAGALLQRSPFGWPLVCAGLLKGGYDLALYSLFAQRPPRESAMEGALRGKQERP